LYIRQCGFREAHSTRMAIMEVIEVVICNLDNNLVTTSVFIYLKKAFDTKDHSIMFNNAIMVFNVLLQVG